MFFLNCKVKKHTKYCVGHIKNDRMQVDIQKSVILKLDTSSMHFKNVYVRTTK